MKKTLAILCVCLFFGFQGCGKKAPPIPPGSVVPPRVMDLAYSVQGDTVTLSWNAPKGEGEGYVDGYEVMKSTSSLDEEECKGCPIVFQRVAKLGEKERSFSEKLVIGKRYIYKVTPVTSYQVKGKDSKLIRFNYPEKKEEEPDQVEPDESGGSDQENSGEEAPAENDSQEETE